MTFLPALRSFGRLRHAVPLVALCSMACPTTAPPKASTAPHVGSAKSPEALPLSRWMEEGVGKTPIGPTLREGTLLLLNGRRVLVTQDGTVKTETVPAPEALFGLRAVATKSGAIHVVAHGEHTIYRLDDSLLGAPIALAHTNEGVIVERIGAGPGSVAVWDSSSDTPSYVDVETGFMAHPQMPALPALKMAFRNSQEGACLFAAAGLAVTTDGGKKWKVFSDTATVEDLDVTPGMVLATLPFDDGEPKQKRIDLNNATLGDSPPQQVPAKEQPLLQWNRQTGTNPVAEAIRGGVQLPSGEFLIAAKGTLARVDLKTGLVTEVMEVAEPDANLMLARGVGHTWLVRPPKETVKGFNAPYGIYSVTLHNEKLEQEGPVLTFERGQVESIRFAPSGAVMVHGGCEPGLQSQAVCVRQPDGKWRSIWPKDDGGDQGAGPLLNGRVAYLRGLSPGEKQPRDLDSAPVDGGSPVPADDSDQPGVRTSWIVTMDASGEEKTLATILWPSAEQVNVEVHGYIEEDEEKRLRVVLLPEHGDLSIVTVDPRDPRDPSQSPQTVKPQAVRDASSVSLHGKLGVAIIGGGLRTSMDGGSTWRDIGVPERLRQQIATASVTPVVSDAGFQIGDFVRLGWGEAPPNLAMGGTTLPGHERKDPGNSYKITCTLAPAGEKEGAPLFTSAQLLDFYEKGKPPKGTSRKRGQVDPAILQLLDPDQYDLRDGTYFNLRRINRIQHRVDNSTLDKWSLLSPSGALSVEGPTAAAANSQATWSFFWFDPSALGERPKHATAPAFKAVSWQDLSTSLDDATVASSGDRALFSFRVGSRSILIRTKGSSVEPPSVVTPNELPSRSVVFGTEKGEPIVWINNGSTQIMAWKTRDQPRPIANIQGSVRAALGEPTKEGVPVMLLFRDGGVVKLLKIPDTSERSPTNIGILDWVPFNGSTTKDALNRLSPCENTSGYGMIVQEAPRRSVQINGVDEVMLNPSYDLRVTPPSVCLAAVSSILKPQSYPTPPGSVDFLRYDLVAKRAEAGNFGLWGLPRQPAHALSCKYERMP